MAENGNENRGLKGPQLNQHPLVRVYALATNIDVDSLSTEGSPSPQEVARAMASFGTTNDIAELARPGADPLIAFLNKQFGDGRWSYPVHEIALFRILNLPPIGQVQNVVDSPNFTASGGSEPWWAVDERRLIALLMQAYSGVQKTAGRNEVWSVNKVIYAQADMPPHGVAPELFGRVVDVDFMALREENAFAGLIGTSPQP
tara:strand:+ start:379 stop:984 length:606 start_codon:yes stop_codon:yes gene_type:complete